MTLMTKILIALSAWTGVSIVVGLSVGRALSFCGRADLVPVAKGDVPFRKAA